MPPEDKYYAPGVYIGEVTSFQPSIPLLHTTVPAFIGSAGSGQFMLTPKKVTSMPEYTQVFGGMGVLVPHLELYFENGGGECFIINAEPIEFLAALDVLRELQEPTLVLAPQMTSLEKTDYTALLRAMLAHCAASVNRFAILDVFGATEYSPDIITAHREDVGDEHLRYGASYFPFLTVTGGGEVCPSAIIAGMYCKVDRDRGIWKSPANIALQSVAEPSVILNNQQQELLNVDVVSGKSINAIRSLQGRGTLVWGARTLAGNDNEWRYIAVQRLFCWVRACVQKGLEPFGFEENNTTIWVKVKQMTENFLTSLWRQGALAGAKPEHAFYVQVGLGQTMTQLDINEGRLIVEIGMAPTRPAEFILLRITQTMNSVL